MDTSMLIEIAVVTATTPPRPCAHYWRVRWLADGDEVDRDETIADLSDVTRMARRQLRDGGRVAWRYYATGI